MRRLEKELASGRLPWWDFSTQIKKCGQNRRDYTSFYSFNRHVTMPCSGGEHKILLNTQTGRLNFYNHNFFEIETELDQGQFFNDKQYILNETTKVLGCAKFLWLWRHYAKLNRSGWIVEETLDRDFRCLLRKFRGTSESRYIPKFICRMRKEIWDYGVIRRTARTHWRRSDKFVSSHGCLYRATSWDDSPWIKAKELKPKHREWLAKKKAERNA